jgi:DNA-binding NarL/FixJ family response regulator
MEGAIRLMVYDKTHLYREGLRLLLQSEKDFHIVLDTADPVLAASSVQQDHIDLCVISLDLSDSDLDSYGSLIWELGLKTKVLILSNSFREDVMLGAACAGVKGYLSGNISAHDVVRAVREISGGGMWFQARGVENGVEPPDKPTTAQLNGSHNLTLQEMRILDMIRQKLRNKEIATRLNISEKTVKCHINRIFKKLKVHKRIEVIDHFSGLFSIQLLFLVFDLLI